MNSKELLVYQVVIPQRVEREIERIDKRYKRRIYAALTVLRSDPFVGKGLEGERKGQYSYEVWPYRIIYEIEKAKLIVLIVKVGHRQ